MKTGLYYCWIYYFMLFLSNENNFTRYLFKILRCVLAKRNNGFCNNVKWGFRNESQFDISRNPYPGSRQINKCRNVSACIDQIPYTLLVF